jgi:hypothetical protein
LKQILSQAYAERTSLKKQRKKRVGGQLHMTESVYSSIDNLQKQLELNKLEMEEIRKQFIEASAVFIANWYSLTAKNHVLKDAQNTLRLGRDKLSSMKIKLRSLVDDSKKIANEFLDEHSLWWHLAPKIENNNASPYLQCGHKCPEIIDKPIRKALGKLGIILEEYGYNVNTKGGNGDDVSVWNNKNISPYPTNPVPYYPDNCDWSKEMRDIMRSYDENYKKAYSAFSGIKLLNQSKLDKQAVDLWNSI